MGILSKLFDRLVGESVKRARHERREAAMTAVLATEGPPPTTLTRQFTIHEALNGSYITFQRRKFNPTGPDDFWSEVYIVRDGESVIDAISTVLVLTEK